MIPSACEEPKARPGPTLTRVKEILWECAWDAVGTALLIQIMESLAFSMVSGRLQEMTPSLPPGLAKQEAEAQPHALWQGVTASFSRNQFALIFGMVLVVKSAPRFARYCSSPSWRNAAAGMLRINRRLSGKWFKLIVSNAFIAYFTTLGLQWAAMFSLTQMIWGYLLDLFRPLLHAMAGLAPRPAQAVGNLFSWYGDNQLKFNFWLLYSAAICDDLGLPNFKSLGRWVWGRWFAAKQQAVETKS